MTYQLDPETSVPPHVAAHDPPATVPPAVTVVPVEMTPTIEAPVEAEDRRLTEQLET